MFFIGRFVGARVARLGGAVLLTLLLGIVFLWSVRTPAVDAAPNTTFMVNTLDDENDSCAVNQCSLREAINEASGGDQIMFSVSGLIDISTHGELIVDSSILISANVPITLSGGGMTRVFKLVTDTHPTIMTEFRGLLITRGHVSNTLESGGGILVAHRGVELILENCRVDDNSAPAGGGVASRGTVFVIDSEVVNNTAYGANGGGLLNERGGTMSVISSNIINNLAELDGGGVKNVLSSRLTIVSSDIVHNFAKKNGGGLDNDLFSSATIRDSTIADNRASGGAGIALNESDLFLSASTVSTNEATDFAGGIINVSGRLTMTNSTLSGNAVTGADSDDGGGGFNQFGSTAVSVIHHSTIVDNKADFVTNRDGVWLEGGQLDFYNTIVAQNGADNCSVDTGGLTSFGANMADDGTCNGFIFEPDLKLGPLTDNEGPTYTHALLSESPALNTAQSDYCPPNDQRALPRLKDHCDVGAFERVTLVYLPLLIR